YEETGSIDLLIHALDREWSASKTDSAHEPPPARPQVRLGVRGPEPAFGAPPLDALFRAGQCGKDSLCRSPDFDFLDDRVAGSGVIHRSSSMCFLRSRRAPFQKTR